MIWKVDEPHGVAKIDAEFCRFACVDLEVVRRGMPRCVRGKVGQGRLRSGRGYAWGYVYDEAVLGYPYEIEGELHFLHPEGGCLASFKDEQHP